jgi:UDP-glucose:(heptosyl)LPS alpha-1,3-glucosyltransferase
MRLAIIRKQYSAFGGAEQFIERLAHQLADRKVLVSIVAESWTGGSASNTQWIQAKAGGISRAGRYRAFLNSARTLLATRPFDLVQSHERFVGADICRLGDGLHRSWLNRYALTLPRWRQHALRLDPFHRQMLQLEAQMFQYPHTHFVANSRLVADEAQEIYGIDASRISLIPNGIDTEFFTPATLEQRVNSRKELQISEHAFVLCAVGVGFARKGFFDLVRCIALCQDVVLLIAGKDRLEAKLRYEITRLNLGNRIRLLGPIQGIRQVYWAADTFVLPSLYDPSSNAVLEALACGLPVITTRNVGTGLEVESAQSGALCERDQASIAEAINAVQRQHSSMSKNARQLALKFSQDHTISAWWNLYQHSINKKAAES